jgi:hypothetical protein
MMRFSLYTLRWQLSTPVLYLCLVYTKQHFGDLAATILANFVGACIFFFVDRLIFKK